MNYMELARHQKGWSQQRLASDHQTQFDQPYISMVERGAGLPTPEQRQRIANALGIPAESLLEEVPSAAVVAERA